MTAEPSTDVAEHVVCDECGEAIEPGALRFIVADAFLLCVGCVNCRKLHVKYHPECDVPTHDMYDHLVSGPSRAASGFLAGLAMMQDAVDEAEAQARAN